MQNSELSKQTDALLWAGVFLGPFGWVIDEGLSYALTQHACSTGHIYVLHAITIVSLLLALAGAAIGWQQLSVFGEGDEEGGGPHDRGWWMARLGIAFGIGFAVVIVALAVPKFMLSPCS